MIYATVSGNLGRDAEFRTAGKDGVCSFSIASNHKTKDKDETTWVDCSIWGKRGEALVKHLTKGSRVTVIGQLSTREHNGKTYLQVRVAEIDLMGGAKGGGGSRGRDDSPPDDRGGAASSGGAADDDIPFAPVGDVG